MIKVISKSFCIKTGEEKESIEMNFPPEKKQETKVLKWLKNIKLDHLKSKHLSRKLKVEIIHIK